MVDEMDLLRDLKTAEPLRAHAYEEARGTLRSAMTLAAAAPQPRRPVWWRTRRTTGFGVAAAGAAAAAVVLALTSTSTAGPSHPVTASGKPSTKATPAAVNPILSQLAANIEVPQVKLPGNATLEIRNQSPTSDTPGDNGFDLYTDDGTYYWGYDKSNLVQSIAEGQDVGQGAFKRAIAAALIAAKGDITTGRANMAIANYLPGTNPDSPAAKNLAIQAIKAKDKAAHIKYTPPKPLTPVQQKEQTDSFIWMNSGYALTAAPENPQVRAGVLAIMATMANVTVTHTTTAGQATLTLTDSWPDLPGGGTESLVINASTGLPIASFDSGPGRSASTYYHTFRVTLANIEAGKF